MQSRPLHTETIAAVGAIVAHRGVGFDNAQASAAGQDILGVATMPADDGRTTAVDVLGTTIVESGAAFARGDNLVVDDQGRFIAAPGNAGEVIVAVALQAATVAGQRREVLLRR